MADVQLTHVGISKFHIELSPTEKPDRYIVTDLQSTNGTRIITAERTLIKITQPMIVSGQTTLLLGNYETTPSAIIRKFHTNKMGQTVSRNPITGEIING
ncbi:MAG: FHA domain-containing protein [Akkermansia sp.]|nr:FHA domain-containing protein [Akkermansia sp.]